ncbi:MAG: lipoprotein [Pseudomonadota bacterium]
MPRLLLIAVLALVSGCGQKGSLFLPPAPGAAAPAPAAAAEPAESVESAPESESRERALPAAQP